MTINIHSSIASKDKLAEFCKGKKSFRITDVSDIGAMALRVESVIEEIGQSCRVYTEYRSAAMAGEILVGGVGVLAAVGIAAHNLATFNPDYEVGKNKIGSYISVTYKK